MDFHTSRNRSLALSLVAVVLGMAMLTAASVPLYRLFCQVTGYGGTTVQAKTRPHAVVNRTITVRFNADIDPGLAWDFKPDQTAFTLKVGENKLASYTAHNRMSEPITGRAAYNVTPFKAGPYFAKIACFCFQEQTLAPGQTVHMPVSFYIDPAIMDDKNLRDVDTITLSYTFFRVEKNE